MPSSISAASRFLVLRRGRRLAAVLIAVQFAALAMSGSAEARVTTVRPFAADSPFNQPIRTSPRVDAKSASMVAYASRTGQLNANMSAYGVPIFTATSTTPGYTVPCRMSGTWGTCPFSGRSMRIPLNAHPSPGSDGAMVVVGSTTNSVDEYWQASSSNGGWIASWGAINSLTGSGWGGSSTGAGASRLAGVIRVSEIENGLIDHALVLQTDNVCRGTVRAPAIKTDGDSARADCIPEGARLQLDPAVKVDSIVGITAGERIVARAMQKYGGYVIDRAGTPMSVSFERTADATANNPGSVYTRAGLTWDYYGMPNVPWQRLRVLNSWNG